MNIYMRICPKFIFRFKSELILSVVLVFVYTGSIAQVVDGGPLEKKVLVAIPKNYIRPTGKVEGKSAIKNELGDKKWVVFSDRDGNTTYYDRNCTREKEKLFFLEACIVAEETEDALRLVRFDLINAPFEEKPGSKKSEFQFKKGVDEQDVGWIKKRNCLLWSNSLISTESNYTQKAIAVKKFTGKEDIKNIIKKGLLDLYERPFTDREFKASKDISIFQYLFPYKMEGDMILLGKSSRIAANSVSDEILGWAHKDQIHLWENAVCLRVNFEPDAIQERRKNKVDVNFFPTIQEAVNFRDRGTGESMPFLYSDPSKESAGGVEANNPYLLGFPIIATTQEQNIYKTGYITNTVNERGESVFTVRKQAELNAKYELMRRNKQNVNIVFVVDGANRKLIRTITSALNGMSIIDGGGDISKFKYRLGAVVFNGDGCEEEEKILPLNTNKENFVYKFNAEATTIPTCLANRSIEGAPLNKALIKACDLFEDATTTNLLIVVGSVADPNKALRESAKSELVSKEAKVLMIQANNKDGKLYDQFLKDVKYLMESAATIIDNKYFKEDLSSGKIRKATLYKGTGDYSYLENSVVTGEIHWRDIGEEFRATDIQNIIKKAINKNERNMTDILAAYQTNTTGADKRVSGIDDVDQQNNQKAMMAYMQAVGIDPEDVEVLANNENYQLFLPAYVPVTTKKLINPLMVRTLFVSRKEFERLDDIFAKLNDSYATQSVRDNVVLTIQQIILEYKGGDQQLDDLKEFTLDDFMKIVTGLSMISNNPIWKYNLNDLKNAKKISSAEIEKLKNIFYSIHKRVKGIGTNLNYRIIQDDMEYMWVPEFAFQTE